MLVPQVTAVVATCDVFCQLNKVNPVVQGALIAAVVALLGIALTAFVTWLQLLHAKKEAARERLFQLKKGVLLGMLDGVGGMRLGINKLLDLEAAPSEAQKIFNEGTQLAQRAHGTASIPLIAAFMTVVEEASVSFVRLLVKRHALDSSQHALDEITARLRASASASSRSTGEDEEAQGAADIDENMRQFERQRRNVDEAVQKFSTDVVKAQLGLHPSTQELTALARLDLGIDQPSDSAGYIQASAVRSAHVADRVSEVLPGALGEAMSNSLREASEERGGGNK